MPRVAASLVLLFSAVLALDNGLGLTPQMGWNSWNHFGCNIHERLIRDTVDAIVSTGLADAGYKYVNLDDCWQIKRDSETHEIIADPEKFPSGIKALADYTHSKGLLFGLYSDSGFLTCQRRPGSLGYEEIDATTYASWNVDYLKYDNCWTDTTPPERRYPPMRDALNKTGRPIFFSMCEWGHDHVAKWGRDVGNSWRTTQDIKDTWESMFTRITKNDKDAQYAGPGGWNDPDMLEVGNGGMTDVEYHTHFALWALSKSPLIIGNDVTNMTKQVFDIITAPELIAVNQDKLGVQGKKVATHGKLQVWAGPLADGSVAAVLVNSGTAKGKVTATWESMGVPEGDAVVRDLWARKDIGTFSGSYTVELNGHASVALRIIPK